MLRFFLFCSFVCLATHLFAKTTEEVVQDSHLAHISSILIFTSQDALTSGTYHFRNIGSSIDIYHLPFIYHFKSTHDYNYFIVGNVGYSRYYITNSASQYKGTILDYNSDHRTYTLGLGGGVRYNFSKSVFVLGGMEAIYSRSGNNITTNQDSVDNAVENIFNKNYNDNITYKIFVLAKYKPTVYDFKPYISVAYQLYQTKSSIDVNSLSSFSTQSSITTFAIGAETPKLYKLNEKYITLEGYSRRNYLGGDVRKSLDFDNYNTFGIITYLYTPEKPKFAKRFFIEGSTVRSSGLEGYNFGIGFSADF